MADIDSIRKIVAAHGQEHVLAFYDQLDQAGQEQLLSQLEAINWGQLSGLMESKVLGEPAAELPAEILPPDMLPADPGDDATIARYAQARQLGQKLLGEGKVAAFIVAGGQGTRLGYDGPKGCLEVPPVRRKSLFASFAEQILATSRRYGKAAPWYVMTSPANDASTRAFFVEHEYFGLESGDVIFFSQGTLPAIGLDGKLLLANKSSLALSPNGHGGSLAALPRA